MARKLKEIDLPQDVLDVLKNAPEKHHPDRMALAEKKRAEREKVSKEAIALKERAHALTEEINALEGPLPERQRTGVVARIEPTND